MAAQQFNPTTYPTSVRIRNRSSGLFLGIRESSRSAGVAAVQGPWSNDGSQAWVLEYGRFDDTYYYIRNRQSNLYLGVREASLEDGKDILQWTLSGDGSQGWLIKDTGIEGTVTIRNAHSTLYWTVQSDNPGAVLTQQKAINALNIIFPGKENASVELPGDVQQWLFILSPLPMPDIPTTYPANVRIQQSRSGLFLGIRESSLNAGVAAVLGPWANDGSQAWVLDFGRFNDPLYYIRNRQSNLYLGVREASLEAGKDILQWHLSGDGSQGWLIEAAEFLAAIRNAHSNLYWGVRPANPGAVLTQVPPERTDPDQVQRWLFLLSFFRQAAWLIVRGQNNSFVYAQLDAGREPGPVDTTQFISVPDGASYLLASLTQGDTKTDFPSSGTMLTITGPDGTKYNEVQSNESCSTFFADSSSGSSPSLRGLFVNRPLAGYYQIELHVPRGVPYLFLFETLPSQAVHQTIKDTLNRVYPPAVIPGLLRKRDLRLLPIITTLGVSITNPAVGIVVLGAVAAGTIAVLVQLGGQAMQNHAAPSFMRQIGVTIPAQPTPSNTAEAVAAVLPDSLRPAISEFLIDPQGGAAVQTYTNYRDFIRAVRARFFATSDANDRSRDFAVQVTLEDRPSPWMRVQATDLYIHRLSTTRSPLPTARGRIIDGDGNWQAIPPPFLRYPDRDVRGAGLSVFAFQTVFGDTMAWLRAPENRRPDFPPAAVPLLAFMVSEAARFDLVEFTVDASLRRLVDPWNLVVFENLRWYPFSDLLRDWEVIARRVSPPDPAHPELSWRVLGIPMRVAGQYEQRTGPFGDIPPPQTETRFLRNIIEALALRLGYPLDG